MAYKTRYRGVCFDWLMPCWESEPAVWSYHYVENVLVLGLMVQSLCSVEHARAGVNPEFPRADGVDAAVHSVAQLVLLISVCCFNLQNLCIRKHILGNCHIVIGLRELWTVIVIIQHCDKYLQL